MKWQTITMNMRITMNMSISMSTSMSMNMKTIRTATTSMDTAVVTTIITMAKEKLRNMESAHSYISTACHFRSTSSTGSA